MTETDEKDDRLREVLGGVKDFKVPDGFTAGVFGKADARRSRSFSFGYRIVIPVAAVATILVVFLGLPFFSGQDEMQNPNDLAGVRNPSVINETEIGATNLPKPGASTEIPPSNPNPVPQNENPVPTEEESEIRTEAMKPAPQVRLGAGAKGSGANPAMGAASIKPDIILSILGVDCEFEDNGWKVKSVAAQSVAAKAGVKAGDVIEAVNDVALTKDGVFLRSLSVDRVVVRRAGVRTTLRLGGN